MADQLRFFRSSPCLRRRVRTAAAVFALAVVATACYRFEIDLVVREDGSGSVDAAMNIDIAMLSLMGLGEGDASETAEEVCRQIVDDSGTDLPSIFGLSELDDVKISLGDGVCAVRFGREWAADEGETVLVALAGDDGPSVRRTDSGGWRFDLNMASLSEELADEEFTAEDRAEAEALGFEFPTMAISVTLPGDAIEHNADSVSQSKYSWELDLFAVDEHPPSLYVQTAPGGGLGPEAIGAIVAGVLLALAALVTLRRHQEAKAAGRDRHGIEAVGDPAEATALDKDTPDESSGTDTADVRNEGSEGGASATDR